MGRPKKKYSIRKFAPERWAFCEDGEPFTVRTTQVVCEIMKRLDRYERVSDNLVNSTTFDLNTGGDDEGVPATLLDDEPKSGSL